MTEPTNAAAGRGLLLVGVAVVIGVLLLSRGLDEGETVGSVDQVDDVVTDDTATDDTATDGTSETIPVGTPPEQVPVVVANGSGVAGAAGFFTEQVQAAGYTSVGEPTNTTTGTVQLDTVYYVDDGTKSWEPEAQAVATALGLAAEAVQPVPPEGAPAEMGNNTVLVVIGEAGTLAPQVTGG